MIDVQKCCEILEKHFATVTPAEFEANLREFCPEIFEEEERLLAVEREKNCGISASDEGGM